MLVKVWTELPSGKNVSLLAKIVEENGDVYTIRYLSPTEDRDHGCVVYRYEEQTYEIDDDSITEYLGTSDERNVGFKPVDDGFVRYDSDSDYVPSSEDEEENSDQGEDEEEFVDEY